MVWKKGQRSPNPGGRRTEMNARKQFEKFGKEALQLIEEVIRNPEVDIKVRLDAAKYMCDRAYGKPTQDTVISAKDGGSLIAVIRDG